MVFPLYELLNVLSDGHVVQKPLDKEYNWTVSPLYEFLNVPSDCHVVQKTLDKEYKGTVSLLYEILYVLSELNSVQKTLDKAYNRMDSPLYEFLDVLWAVYVYARKITSIHIQEQYIFMQVYQHCSPNHLLSKALVLGTNKILHKLQKWGVTLPRTFH
jgi:hypothetical protein